MLWKILPSFLISGPKCKTTYACFLFFTKGKTSQLSDSSRLPLLTLKNKLFSMLTAKLWLLLVLLGGSRTETQEEQIAVHVSSDESPQCFSNDGNPTRLQLQMAVQPVTRLIQDTLHEAVKKEKKKDWGAVKRLNVKHWILWKSAHFSSPSATLPNSHWSLRPLFLQ